MVNQTAVKNKISSVLTRTDLRKSIELLHYTEVTDRDGEKTYTFGEQETIYGILLDYVSSADKHDRAGLYNDSTMIMLIPIETTINKQDIVEIFSTYYTINNISKWILGETLLGYRIFIKEFVGTPEIIVEDPYVPPEEEP